MLQNIKKTDLIAQVYANLADLEGVEDFWPEAEVIAAIDETLFLFGSVGDYWKDRISVKTEIGKSIYDLYSNDVTIGQELVAPSKTIGELLNIVNLSLMSSYTLDNIKEIVVNKLNEFNLRTSIVAKVADVNVPAANIEKVPLPADFLDDIWVAYKYQTVEIVNDVGVFTDVYIPLSEDNEYNVASFFNDRYRIETDYPRYYSILLSNAAELRIYPLPSDAGILQIIYLKGITIADITNEDYVLPIPNNLFYYLKYAILEDLLTSYTKNPDLGRINYCKSRWAEGIFVGKSYNMVLLGAINEYDVGVDSIKYLDSFQSEWQNTIKAPTGIALANNNILAVNSRPDEIYSIDLDVISNAPVNEEYIQLSDEYIEALISYCKHVLMFKCGFYELNSTMKEVENILKIASNYNTRVKVSNLMYEDIAQKSNKQEIDKDRGVAI